MSNILCLDISTNSIKAAVIDEKGLFLGLSEMQLDHIHQEHGWSEQNPKKLIETSIDLIENCLLRNDIDPASIQAISLTNQKGALIALDLEKAQPLTNIIAPNDKRVEGLKTQLEKKNLSKVLAKKTMLLPSNNLTALKMLWIQENCKKAQELSKNNRLGFASLETFFIYSLSTNKEFTTDATNAHATGLVNIETLEYDNELLSLFNIERSSLAQIKATNEVFASIELSIFPKPLKIISSLCNQQSAILATGSLRKGDLKCTFSSTCSVFLQLDDTLPKVSHHFSHTISQKLDKKNQSYCMENNIYHSGSIVKWLQDSLGLIKTPREAEALAYSVPDSGGVFFVPTFSGIAAPYWDSTLQGSILGLKESTNIGHLARASLEGLAYQTADTIQAMIHEANVKIDTLKCGGKMAKNTFLMQMIADLLGIKVVTASTFETPLLGSALLGHLALQNIKTLDEMANLFRHDQIYEPKIDTKKAKKMLKNWHAALHATKDWSNKIA